MKLNKYNKMIVDFFSKNDLMINNTIKKIIKKYYSIPIDKEDVFIYLYYDFMTVEEETEFYQLKLPIEKFIMSRLKYKIFKYCNNYISNKHKVLNNYISYDSDETIDFECDKNYYINESILDVISTYEFEIIYQIRVLKKSRKKVALEHQLSLSSLRTMEYTIINKIKNKISNMN